MNGVPGNGGSPLAVATRFVGQVSSALVVSGKTGDLEGLRKILEEQIRSPVDTQNLSVIYEWMSAPRVRGEWPILCASFFP